MNPASPSPYEADYSPLSAYPLYPSPSVGLKGPPPPLGPNAGRPPLLPLNIDTPPLSAHSTPSFNNVGPGPRSNTTSPHPDGVYPPPNAFQQQQFPPPNSYNNTYAGPPGAGAGAVVGPRRQPSSGNLSPPSSISRSSDGVVGGSSNPFPNGHPGPPQHANTFPAPPLDSRQYAMMEDALEEHYKALLTYLAPSLRDSRTDARQNRARDKLLRLSPGQFQELSTDVYDELQRREEERRRGGPAMPGNTTPRFLPPNNNFHFKRNQARQKLSTLPPDRFTQLATDVFYELERRFPRFVRGASRANSLTSSSGGRRAPSRSGFVPPPRTASRGTTDGRSLSRETTLRAPYAESINGTDQPAPPRSYASGIQPGLDEAGGLDLSPSSPEKGGIGEKGKPLTKQFQSNVLVPSKGVLVEDDDGGFGDGIGVNGGMMGGEQDAVIRSQASEIAVLTNKLTSLEAELALARSSSSASNAAPEDWQAIRANLETQLSTAQNDLAACRTTAAATERDLRAQVDDARRSERDLERELRAQLDEARRSERDLERDLRAQLEEARDMRKGSASATADPSKALPALPPVQRDVPPEEWADRYEAMQAELAEQQRTTEEVRREAGRFLEEMRALSAQSVEAEEGAGRLREELDGARREVGLWREKYSRLKAGGRKSLGGGAVGLYSGGLDERAMQEIMSPKGGVTDFHVVGFMVAVEEMLGAARQRDVSTTTTTGGMSSLMDCLKSVVHEVRKIRNDVDSVRKSGMNNTMSANTKDPLAQLQTRLSGTAATLITASKTHAAAAGLAPVALVDAAAANLTAVVVDIVRTLRIRPTSEREREMMEDQDPSPPPTMLNSPGSSAGFGNVPSGMMNGASLGGFAPPPLSQGLNVSGAPPQPPPPAPSSAGFGTSSNPNSAQGFSNQGPPPPVPASSANSFLASFGPGELGGGPGPEAYGNDDADVMAPPPPRSPSSNNNINSNIEVRAGSSSAESTPVKKPAPLALGGVRGRLVEDSDDDDGGMTPRNLNGGPGPTAVNESGAGGPNRVRRPSSLGSSTSAGEFSAYSSRYSSRRESEGRGLGIGPGPGALIAGDMGMVRDGEEMERFKSYLEETTSLLVRSIQPLVSTIRSKPTALADAADARFVSSYVSDIADLVSDICEQTSAAASPASPPSGAGAAPHRAAMAKHLPPLVDALLDLRDDLLRRADEGRDGRDQVPRVAFRVARAVKELVLRLERIEAGELTVQMDVLPLVDN